MCYGFLYFLIKIKFLGFLIRNKQDKLVKFAT